MSPNACRVKWLDSNEVKMAFKRRIEDFQRNMSVYDNPIGLPVVVRQYPFGGAWAERAFDKYGEFEQQSMFGESVPGLKVMEMYMRHVKEDDCGLPPEDRITGEEAMRERIRRKNVKEFKEYCDKYAKLTPAQKKAPNRWGEPQYPDPKKLEKKFFKPLVTETITNDTDDHVQVWFQKDRNANAVEGRLSDQPFIEPGESFPYTTPLPDENEVCISYFDKQGYLEAKIWTTKCKLIKPWKDVEYVDPKHPDFDKNEPVRFDFKVSEIIADGEKRGIYGGTDPDYKGDDVDEKGRPIYGLPPEARGELPIDDKAAASSVPRHVIWGMDDPGQQYYDNLANPNRNPDLRPLHDTKFSIKGLAELPKARIQYGIPILSGVVSMIAFIGLMKFCTCNARNKSAQELRDPLMNV